MFLHIVQRHLNNTVYSQSAYPQGKIQNLIDAAATTYTHLEFFSISGLLGITGPSYALKVMENIFSNICTIFFIITMLSG
jgi:hypothetical protein